ncbi:MAG: SMC family ATPase, partial [Acidimicrobiales bacterium]|nr:SMC family ATPase [Acidimicrobiales bacterium]
MHFERLTISGFGPYAGTEVIDFDALATKGLFSVSGATGSGKTTIFDALTFALYGDLPGMRPAGTVRSEHASPKQKCEVELVFRASNARWKVVRTPKHLRPKLRGTGVTEVKNQAALYRWDRSGWNPLTTSIHHVTRQCTELVGLSQDQFERVGLLPQGEFKRLLVANSAERKKLFRTLFGTATVEAAVRHLVDDAKAAEADAALARNRFEEIEAEASALLTKLNDAAAAETDGVLSLPTEGATSETAGTLANLESVAHDVQRRVLPMLEGAEAAANSATRRASEALGQATELAAKVTLRTQLQSEQLELDELGPKVEANAAAAELARRARPVIAAHRQLTIEQTHQQKARTTVTAARQKVERLAGDNGVEHRTPASADDLQVSVAALIPEVNEAIRRSNERDQLLARIAVVSANLARARQTDADYVEQHASLSKTRTEAMALMTDAEAAAEQVASLLTGLEPLEKAEHAGTCRDAARADVAAITAAFEHARGQLAELDADLAVTNQRMTELRAAVDQLPQLTIALNDARQLAENADRLAALNEQLNRAEHALVDAAEAQAATARAFALGVAPRLAQQLVEGEPCLVCGSPEHPRPAEETDELVTQDQMDSANSRYNTAYADLAATRSSVDQLTTTLGPEPPSAADAKVAADVAQANFDRAHEAKEELATVAAAVEVVISSRDALVDVIAKASAQLELATLAVATAEGELGPDAQTPLSDLIERAAQH